MVKKSETPAGTVLAPPRSGAGRLGRVDRVLRLPTLGRAAWRGLAAVAVKAVVLIWKLAQMNILTIRDRREMISALERYCKLDTAVMVAVWAWMVGKAPSN